MAIVGSVFAMLGRFAGRLLNSALGWATILLFGKSAGGDSLARRGAEARQSPDSSFTTEMMLNES